MVAWPFSIAIMAIGYLFVFNFKNFVLLLLVLPVQFYAGRVPLKMPVSFVDYSAYTDRDSDSVGEDLAKKGSTSKSNTKFFRLKTNR